MNAMIEIDRAERLMLLARKHGATRIKVEGIEIEMGAPPAVEPARPSEAHEAIGEAGGRPTDDELLMWSAPATTSTEEK